MLRPGGCALIYVWAMEQTLNNKKSNYLKDTTTNTAQLPPSADDTIETSVNDKKGSDVISSLQKQEATEPDVARSAASKQSNDQHQLNERRYLDVHVNRTEFKAQDLLVPWHLRDNKLKSSAGKSETTHARGDDESVYHRFYHVFGQGELEALCLQVEKIRIKDSYYDKGNWCVIFEKCIDNLHSCPSDT